MHYLTRMRLLNDIFALARHGGSTHAWISCVVDREKQEKLGWL